MKNIRIQKGITLVSLVVTIVVLLILSLTAIGAMQEFGIIDRANEAKNSVEEADARLKVQSILLDIATKKNIYGVNTDITQKFSNVETIIVGEKYKVTQDGYEFIIQGKNYEFEIVDN